MMVKNWTKSYKTTSKEALKRKVFNLDLKEEREQQDVLTEQYLKQKERPS